MKVNNLLDYFEKFIIIVLLLVTGGIILISTFELVVTIVHDITTLSKDDKSLMFLNSSDLLNVFSFVLLVVIGLELFETIKYYLSRHILQAEIILVVALTAIARKVIILDYDKQEPLTIIGVALLVFALAISYFLIKRANREYPDKN
jgi:uncharacterized membrane protein (DUF373 family)